MRSFYSLLAAITVGFMLTFFSACGGAEGGTKEKGGGKKGASSAKDAGQKSGSKATDNKDTASGQGDELDGIVCDDEMDGVAWCETDSSIIFCLDGEWWELDCTAIEEEAFCGVDEDLVVDCWSEE